MALTTRDVLTTLNDSVTLNMFFFVGPIYVSAIGYRWVRDYIYRGNIEVLGGAAGQNLAFYNNQTDILTTQDGIPPANLDQRALLLHECTHALVDVLNLTAVTRHIDELAAYIAQHVYILRSNPNWTVAPNNKPWQDFFQSVVNLIQARHLDTVEGNGAMVSMDDLDTLERQLIALPGVNYGSIPKDALTGANGTGNYGLIERLSRKVASGIAP
jgi:hypothetical protein